jgi:ABC-type multidrug transport system fused ATPase/permease subunit
MLETLDHLRGTIEEFADKADRLNSDFKLKTVKEHQRRDSAAEEQARQLALMSAEAEAEFQSARAALEAKHASRKALIGRAYQSAKEQTLRKVENRIGARKYELQKRMLQAERDRDAGVAAAQTAIQEFRTQLAAEQASLARLEGAAQKAFDGYRTFRRDFLRAYEKAAVDAAPDEHQLLEQLRSLLTKAGGALARYQKFLVLRFFRYFYLWLALALCLVPLAYVLARAGVQSFAYGQAAAAAGAIVILVLALRFFSGRRAAPVVVALSNALASARRLHDACAEKAEVHFHQELERIKGEFTATTQAADQDLKRAVSETGQMRVACRMEADAKAVRAGQRHERMNSAKLRARETQRNNSLQTMKRAAEARQQALSGACDERVKKLTADVEAGWRALEADWKNRVEPLWQALRSARTVADELFPAWDKVIAQSWTPPAAFAQAAKFGELAVDLEKFCAALPKDPRLALPGPSQFTAPLCLACPEQGSVLFETAASGQQEVMGALNDIILRLLAGAPAGRLNFTILDPVGLGQNFAGVMHLADYEDQLINNRIWTQSTHIEQRLGELNEHMEKVIQMYLRNEYQTIAEYNEQAGVIAEKYHFLVVADFPANFTETAAKRLLSIVASGARCGVYTLIHWDRRQPLPQDFIPDELRKSSICITSNGSTFTFTGKPMPGARLLLEAPPPPEQATDLIHQIGRLSRDSSRVEVPFAHVTPPAGEEWTVETTNELRVPVGRTGATKLQYLAIGKGTCQHALIAGKTGSGKSTLFHVIITNLALWCSPEQVEFYLVDFKKGVEFKCYASKRLPHARVVAIESDREFGLSVLQRVDDELKRRGDMFRELGVQDIPGYKRAGGKEAIPRTLLMIDEFQELFVEDDKIAQTASLLLDRIVRQGRAFGIHVLLGSQTLGGAYTVARTTLGQMVIRIALQCNEADAYLIMDDSNPAPRLLSRPGEGIYNDMAGALEGNSPFQVVWLPDAVRDASLAKVRALADLKGDAYPGPIVFEGNAPADARENALLRGVLETKAVKPPAVARIWLGAPNSIKGPTEAAFQRQSGNNLLIVGQRDEAVLAMFSLGLIALAAQYPAGAARIIMCDATAPGTPHRDYLEKVVRSIPRDLTLARPGDLPGLMQELAAEMNQRAQAADPDAAPPVFLFINGLQKYSRLRHEEDFGFSAGDADAPPNPAVVLNNLICEGTRLGFHVIAACDTYNNINRFLSRKAFSEFEMRVLFQMSANDSASLIDNPKASLLGLHRAVLFNAQEGYLETFRPYALPPVEWLEQAAGLLNRPATVRK